MNNGLLNTAESRDPILTVSEVAQELRCCKAQVHKLIHGLVKGVSKLPAISIGRKKIIRRSSLTEWIQSNEANQGRVILGDQPGKNAVGRMN